MKGRLAVMTVLLVLGLRVWWRAETEAPIGGPSAEIVVPPGASTQAVGQRLAEAGLVPRPWTFALLVRFRGDDGRIKAGRYRFEGPYSLLDIEQKLVEGEVERREVTFPEGRNIFEMAEIAGKAGLAGERFLAAGKDPSAVVDLDPEAKAWRGICSPKPTTSRTGPARKRSPPLW